MPSPVGSLRTAAAVRPDRPVIRIGGTTISYGELCAAAERFARRLLSSGFEPGDRVGLGLPNTPGYAVAFYGSLMAGGVVVPLNPRHDEMMLSRRLHDSGTRVLVVTSSTPPGVRRAAELSGTDLLVAVDLMANAKTSAEGSDTSDCPANVDGEPAAIFYTRGDDDPWGAVLTHHNLGWSAEAATGVLGITEGDLLACHFPLFYPLGYTYGLGAAIAAGCCLELPGESGDSEADLIGCGSDATVMSTYPLLASHLLSGTKLSAATKQLRTLFCSGGKSLTDRVRTRLETELSCGVLQGYGPVEASALGCAVPTEASPRRGSLGVPVPGVEMAVVDGRGRQARSSKAGRLIIKGPNVMIEYWGRPKDTARAFSNGWLVTADKARKDADGHVYLADGSSWAGVPGGRRSSGGGLLSMVKKR